MDFIIHRFSEASVSTWSGGTTTQLFIFPTQANFAERNFDFRISSATIETETSDFTPLPTYNRLLAILEGEMEIQHEGKYLIHLTSFENDSFHGSWKTTSRGKVRDFNVIYSDDYQLDFKLILLKENKTIKKSGDYLFLFMLAEFKIQGEKLEKYDLVEIETNEIELKKEMHFFEIRLKKV